MSYTLYLPTLTPGPLITDLDKHSKQGIRTKEWGIEPLRVPTPSLRPCKITSVDGARPPFSTVPPIATRGTILPPDKLRVTRDEQYDTKTGEAGRLVVQPPSACQPKRKNIQGVRTVLSPPLPSNWSKRRGVSLCRVWLHLARG